MTALFGQIMEQLNSSVVVLLAILILSACAAVKLGRLLEKFAQHEHRLERADDTHDLLVKLAAKVEYIYEFTNPRSVARSQSPLALPPLGQEIAADTNADAMYEAHKGVLLENIKIACPVGTNAYDIQMAARKPIWVMLNGLRILAV